MTAPGSDRQTVTLLMSEFVTHNVRRFVVSRPTGFEFAPGQGVELAIDNEEYRHDARPFTPTSLTDDEVLEFTIKRYDDHDGVTRALHGLSPGANLLMSEPFGTISYRGAGVFLAGGAGITPFIAILRDRHRAGTLSGHKLIFSNRTPADFICEKEFRYMLGTDFIPVCTGDAVPGYAHRRIDKTFLQDRIDDFTQRFYVCGPPGFMKSVNDALRDLGADASNLVFEK